MQELSQFRAEHIGRSDKLNSKFLELCGRLLTSSFRAPWSVTELFLDGFMDEYLEIEIDVRLIQNTQSTN